MKVQRRQRGADLEALVPEGLRVTKLRRDGDVLRANVSLDGTTTAVRREGPLWREDTAAGEPFREVALGTRVALVKQARQLERRETA